MHRPSKILTLAEAREKIYRYCAYQERCHQEVKRKLFEYGLSRKENDELLTELITEGYLNEERFAKAFAGGKFRMKKWGRIKITNELEFRGLTANCIRSGLKEIEEENYIKTLEEILQKKFAQTDAENSFIKKDKIASYAIQKGYEPDLVWKILKEHPF